MVPKSDHLANPRFDKKPSAQAEPAVAAALQLRQPVPHARGGDRAEPGKRHPPVNQELHQVEREPVHRAAAERVQSR